MKRHLFATATAAALLASLALVQPGGAVTVSQNPPVIVSAPGTVDFVKTMVNGTRFEMASSRLALQKAQSPEVKRFARWMLIDHSRAGALLQQAVDDGGVTLLRPIAFDADHQAKLAQLEAASPAEFDALYIAMQIEEHQNAVAWVRPYASTGANHDIQLWAADVLPTFEMHLKHAEEIAASNGYGS